MTAFHDEKSGEIIKGLVNKLRERLDPKQARLIGKFALHYYASVASEELRARTSDELYATLLSHWAFIKQRKPGDVKVRVYNPDFDHHGWESSHSIVEVSHDDMPFLVDTTLMALNRMGVNMHFIVHAGDICIVRDDAGQIVDVITNRHKENGCVPEAQLYIEIDRQPDEPKVLDAIKRNIESVLKNVRLVVGDFPAMKRDFTDVIADLERNMPRQDDNIECLELLRMVDSDHFTFLGSAYYELDKGGKSASPVKKSFRGFLTDQKRFESDKFVQELVIPALDRSDEPLLITKSDEKSTVHRHSHMDMLVVRRYDDQQETMGVYVIVGLFTSAMYHTNPAAIPLLRRKVEKILKRSGFAVNGHDYKSLYNILESFPRDELFQIEEDSLFVTVMGILQIQERQRIRLFIRRDVFGRYYSCMVYVPRDMYNTELRIKMQNILLREFNGFESTFSPNFLESVLCRIDFMIHVDRNQVPVDFDVKKIESKLVVAARNWKDDLRDSLIECYGENQGAVLANKYWHAFPAGYREAFLARSAVTDIEYIESTLSEEDHLGMCFYRMLEEDEHYIHFKLFRLGKGLPLSDVLPLLENMGLKVIEEHPYQVTIDEETSVWISDFGMLADQAVKEIDEISDIFKEAFGRVWHKRMENDAFNSLVVKAAMPWQDVVILRMYAKYMLQTKIGYSQKYIEDTLRNYPEVAKQLVSLFKVRFEPELAENSDKAQTKISKVIDKLLDDVSNLDGDRIIRQYRHVILATLRTNFFQDESGLKDCVSIKLSPADIPNMPQPYPLYEIFVYSPIMEGVHLRGSKVSRGGLRWSDRLEDYRTEVLGLMKAQQVKNAVIVPLGAKGGFVLKQATHSREEFLSAGVSAYKTFISGLLDITDNIVDNKVVPPKRVVRHDADDTYFVVAADKGTATFSDYANEVAKDYNFWLGDAFASGGCNGYDHKKMGITARGAWESVKRNFLEMGRNTQLQDFTVVGVGDMAGDVFGNGMLLSRHIRLIAAFNHMHIFIDPNPDAAKSWKERKRLFDLPRSNWLDYDTKLISAGGGVFERSAKSIKLTPQIKQALGVEVNEIEPSGLIRHILKAPVDLLWNGGIGTYVRASMESNHDVGDPANDSLRISADQLRCKVVGEGGNLGFTQLSRIEYARLGGKIYTDAIDNSAGVNCSDHEVNIKILLDMAVKQGDLSLKKRNSCLAAMEDEVAGLVLEDNYRQTQAISAGVQRQGSMVMNIRLLHELEREGHLSRTLEFLPSDKELMARHSEGMGLTRPEFCVLMAYSKTVIKKSLLSTDLPDDLHFVRYMENEFPVPMREQFGKLMADHPLRRELVATQVTNTLVHIMGITFVHRMYDETGATPAMITRAFAIAYRVFGIRELWYDIEALDGKVDAQVQYRMMEDAFRQIRRACRWLLRNNRQGFDIDAKIDELRGPICELTGLLEKCLGPEELAHRDQVLAKYLDAGVPEKLANKVVLFRYMSPAFDIIDAALGHKISIEEAANIYYELNTALSLGWFRIELARIRDQGYWEMLSGSSLKDDLDRLQRLLTVSVITSTDASEDLSKRVEGWRGRYDYLVRRWLLIAEDIRLTEGAFERFLVAIRSLQDLAQVCTYGSGQK